MLFTTWGGEPDGAQSSSVKDKGAMLLPLILLALTTGALLFNPYNAMAAEKSAKAAKKSASPAKKSAEYLIGPEDVLEISVWKNEDLSKLVIVRPDGMITLPLLGDIQAGGRTPSALHGEIMERLVEYQKSTEVSVIVQEVNSYKIFILGDITRPGIYPLKSRTTIIQAIAMAGGFNEFASKNKIVLIREKGQGKKHQEKIRIQFGDIVNVKKSKDNNLVLKPGDTIFVP